MMQKSQVLHHSENGGNPGTSMMHNSDAQSEHDLRLRARLIQRAGSGEAARQARRCRLHQDLPREGQRREGRAARSEEHTTEIQAIMRISSGVFSVETTKQINTTHQTPT